jgi:hypothetical protein
LKIIIILSALAGCLIASCTGNATVRQTVEPISEPTAREIEAPITFDDDVVGISWRLSEIKKGVEAVYVDRAQLEADGMGDVYTLRFENGNVSGKGAPNNFRAPYKVESASLSIGLAARTLIASIREPVVLQENEFFDYLAKVSSWSLADGILTLATVDADGSETALSFSRNDLP